MDYPFPQAGQSPKFEEDDVDWALGELLHMMWQARRVGYWPHDYNRLLFYRSMHVLGCQPLQVRLKCLGIVRGMVPDWMKWQGARR